MRQHPDLKPEQVYLALAYFYDQHTDSLAQLKASLQDAIAQEMSPDAPARVASTAGTGQTIFVRDEQQFAMFQALAGGERNG